MPGPQPEPKTASSRAYRGLSAEQRRLERRGRLLAAAHQVFGREGYSGASVRAICREAGLTERYFYESFTDREAAFAAVYLAAVERLSARVAAAVMEVAPLPGPMAQAGLRSYFEQLRQDRGGARVMLFELLGISPAIDQLYRRQLRDFAELVAHLAAPVTGRSPADLGLISTGLVGAAVQIAMRWVLDDYQPGLDEVTAAAVSIFAAVSRDPSPSRG